MRTRTERTINEAYLIIEDDKKNMPDRDFETKMLEDNSIDGILPITVKKSEGGTAFYYSIRGKIPLSTMYEDRELRSDALKIIIGGLKFSLSRCEEYMILTDHVLLSPQYVYADSESKEIRLCVYPYSEGCLSEELNKLAEYLIAHTDHNENLAIDLAYGFYRQVTTGDYRFDDLLNLVNNKTEIKPEEERVDAEVVPIRRTNGNGGGILVFLVVLIVIFCFALCVLMLYFR